MQRFEDSVRDRISSSVTLEKSPAPKGSTEPATPIWTPVRTSSAIKAPKAVEAPNERELLATCMEPVDPDLGHRLGNEKKEERLVRLFDQLSSAEAFALHERLANPLPTDELAMAFDSRLAIERRKRLLAYLGSAKRRAALGR